MSCFKLINTIKIKDIVYKIFVKKKLMFDRINKSLVQLDYKRYNWFITDKGTWSVFLQVTYKGDLWDPVTNFYELNRSEVKYISQKDYAKIIYFDIWIKKLKIKSEKLFFF